MPGDVWIQGEQSLGSGWDPVTPPANGHAWESRPSPISSKRCTDTALETQRDAGAALWLFCIRSSDGWRKNRGIQTEKQGSEARSIISAVLLTSLDKSLLPGLTFLTYKTRVFCLDPGSSHILRKGLDSKYLRFCGLYGLCHNYLTLQSWHESSHRKTCPCSNKTCLTGTGGRLDSTPRP